MTDKIQLNATMSLAGYHHLPKVPVMGKNVRTAQSKSSVKTSLESSENKDATTMLHLDGGSKIVKLLTSGSPELIENMSFHEDKVKSPLLTNGIETSKDDSHDGQLKMINGDVGIEDHSLPVLSERRGRKKKISEGERLSGQGSFSKGNEVNDASLTKSSRSISSVLGHSKKSNIEKLPKTVVRSDEKIVDSNLQPKKRGRKKKIKITEDSIAGDLRSDSEPSLCHQSIDSSYLDASLNKMDSITDGLDDSNFNNSNVEMNLKRLETSGVDSLPVPVKKKRGRKKKIRESDGLLAESLVFKANSTNQSMDMNCSPASLKKDNQNEGLDIEMHSHAKRNKLPQKIAVRRSSSKIKEIFNSRDLANGAEGVSFTSQLQTATFPRRVSIMPGEVPTDVQLEKLRSMDSSSYDLQHPHLMDEGDVFWARVSGHPYWPCMISKCPFTKMISRIKGDVKVVRSYHVQFFGNDCERSWINEPSLMLFQGKADFMEKAALEALKFKTIKKGKSAYNPYKINPTRSHEWNIAVEEVEAAYALSRKDRLVQYTFDYVFIEKVKKQKDNISMSPSPSLPSPSLAPGKRKRKDSPSKSSQEQPKLKKQKLNKSLSSPSIDAGKEETSFEAYCARHYSSVKEHHPDWDASFLCAYLRQQWSDISSKCLSSPVVPVGEKRLKKPTKKIVESMLQEESFDAEKKSKPKTSPSQPQKRGRKRKVSEPLLPTQDLPANSILQAKEKDDLSFNQPEFKPSKSVVTSSLKLSQDSDSSSTEGKKRTKEKKPYELEIFKLHLTAKVDKEHVCSICEESGELIECTGTCGQHFHSSCLHLTRLPSTGYKCEECALGTHSCFSCKIKDDSTKKCSVSQCGKYYHDECIRKLKFARVISESKGFVCPLHICATCAVDNIRNPKATKGRLFRCMRCPVAFHVGDFCLSAGSENIGGSYIVCSDHFERKKSFSQHAHVNITWCFSCSKGGTLLCCDTCPASYHAECVKVEKTPDGAWHCEDCVSGRKLLYGSIVWVKIGNYRWWPGEICHPRHVPLNIQDKAHNIGEFPVRFFGSHDYYWIHRGRVFLFEEGDKASRERSSKGLHKVYTRGVEEATKAFQLWTAAKAKKEEQEQERNDKKPSHFKFVKNNVPIGNVQIYKAELSEIPHCECTYDQEEPCGSDCLNRMMMYECHPAVCHAKEKCNNQRFQKRQHAQCEPFRAEGRGWGLHTLQDLKKGQFVVEYVGDLIDEEECKRRIRLSHEDNITNFYMLTMDKNRIIDAGPKGNYSRFMNHSCCPNMETQKWTVNGDVRVGLFALCDIPSGTELVFNYNLECLGNEKTACACGAENCSGFLGVRPKTAAAIANEKKMKELKKKRKKKKLDVKKEYEDDCFRCGEGGELVMCDRTKCPKVYHLQCLNLTKPPSGKWSCPWHHCDECGKAATSLCTECPNSFCSVHASGNTQEIDGCLVCSDHTELEEDLSKFLDEESVSDEADKESHGNQSSGSDVATMSESTVSTSIVPKKGDSLQDGEIHELNSQDKISVGSKLNGIRQPGLPRRGRVSKSPVKKTGLTSSTSMQRLISSCKTGALNSVQDSDDNESISDLVIDIS